MVKPVQVREGIEPRVLAVVNQAGQTYELHAGSAPGRDNKSADGHEHGDYHSHRIGYN